MVSAITIVCTGLAVTCFMSCDRFEKSAPRSHSVIAQRANTRPTERVESVIIDEKARQTGWQGSRLSGGQTLSVVHFSSGTDGWLGSLEGTFQKTTDGGVTWKSVGPLTQKDAYVASVFFVNRLVGWVAFRKTAIDMLKYRENRASIMRTTDGGITWFEQYVEEALDIGRIDFVDEQEGWAAGSRYLMRKTLQGDHLVLHTHDGGQHWEDVSKQLNLVLPRSLNAGYVADIKALSSSRAILFTTGGRVVRTQDGGKNWEEVASIQDESDKSVMPRMGVLESNKVWAVGGADSIEGMWGVLARMDTDGSWIIYRLTGVFFKDALFLSDSEVVVCGSMPSNNAAARPGGARDAVILSSIDGGRNWTILFREKRIGKVYSLALADRKRIYAVGDGGLIVRVELPPIGR